jgi:hypothetical protein
MDLHTAPLDTNAMLTVWIALSQVLPAPPARGVSS